MYAKSLYLMYGLFSMVSDISYANQQLQKSMVPSLAVCCLRTIASKKLTPTDQKIYYTNETIKEKILLLLNDKTTLRNDKILYIKAYTQLSQEPLKNFLETVMMPYLTCHRFENIVRKFYSYIPALERYQTSSNQMRKRELLLYIMCNDLKFHESHAHSLIIHEHDNQLIDCIKDEKIPWLWFTIRYSGQPDEAVKFLLQQGAYTKKELYVHFKYFPGNYLYHTHKIESPLDCARRMHALATTAKAKNQNTFYNEDKELESITTTPEMYARVIAQLKPLS